MQYIVTLGYWPNSPGTITDTAHACTCAQAQHGCTPTYVFSIRGQVEFRQALHHLATCRTRDCISLRPKVLHGMQQKLTWLLQEESLLGCVQIQPYLYGTKRIILDRRQFPTVAAHLSTCPRESCAQLRRALLLTVRERVRPQVEPA